MISHIRATLFNVEGHILGKYLLKEYHINNLLRFALGTYESEVFIHPTSVSNNAARKLKALYGEARKKHARSCRWWVFLCHRYDLHWALAIHDQAAGLTFYMDSLKN